jgi:hypothetical protein
MARTATASKPTPAPAGGLQCPYCLSNLRPVRASIAQGTVEGSTTTLRAVPRPDIEPAAEPATRKPAKRKVALSGKVDSAWTGKAGKR